MLLTDEIIDWTSSALSRLPPTINAVLLFLEFISSSNNEVMAFSEQLLLNVNLKKRKTENYPKWALKRLTQLKKDHKKIQFPKNIGLSIKIKDPIL